MLESNDTNPKLSKYSASLLEEMSIDMKCDPGLFDELMFIMKQSPSLRISMLSLTSFKKISQGLTPLNLCGLIDSLNMRFSIYSLDKPDIASTLDVVSKFTISSAVY